MDDTQFNTHWGFQENPFSTKDSHELVYFSQPHSAALNAATNAIRRGNRAMYLSGPPGSGKSLVCSSLRSRLQSEGRLVGFLDDKETPGQYPLVELLELFGFKIGTISDTEQPAVLRAFLTRYHRDRKSRIVVVIDRTAFVFEHGVQEPIAELLAAERDGSPLLTLLFTGQVGPDEAAETAPSLWPYVEVKYELQPLSLADVRLYIQYRLRSSGCQRHLFDSDAIALIHERSGGIAGHINPLCLGALAAACARGADSVTAGLVPGLNEPLSELPEAGDDEDEPSAHSVQAVAREAAPEPAPPPRREPSVSPSAALPSPLFRRPAPQLDHASRRGLRAAVERTICRRAPAPAPAPAAGPAPEPTRAPADALPESLPAEELPAPAGKSPDSVNAILEHFLRRRGQN